MRSLFGRRVVEATPQQVVMSGGGIGLYGNDPIDNDIGYTRAGGNFRRDVPPWTRETARDYAVTSYRMNPMCTAILDTFTAFCVGDSGVSPTTTDPKVREVVDEFWNDPYNRLGQIQEVMLRSQMLLGEKVLEIMEGPSSGVLRFCPVEPAAIINVSAYKGNPLWLDKLTLPPTRTSNGENEVLDIVRVNDETGLREGNAIFWAPWRALDTDIRGVPYINSILDWLDNYDSVLSDLMDRTRLARYAAWQVKVAGGPDAVESYVKRRGGKTLPPSGSIEVTNESVEWVPLVVSSGSDEDTRTNGAILTNIASGAGLARTWLADPEDANRATSQTMAEPVRRRVGGVQKVWLAQMTEFCRLAVDRAVAAKRLPETVTVADPRTGIESELPAAMTVTVTGPEVAAADAQFTAQVLLNLSTGLNALVDGGLLSREAAALAAQKAWESYVGVPWRAELAAPDTNPDDLAEHVDTSAPSSAFAPPVKLTVAS